jgi:hypothetical protein
MSAIAPDARRVDPLQLRALLRLTLKQSLGPGTDASTGSKGHPLRQILFSMTTLGVMLSARAWRVADLPSYLVLLFAAVFVIVILAINPDSQDVQERRLEILASKPIAARTLLSARTILLLVLAGLLAGCLGLVPMAVAVALRPGLAARGGLVPDSLVAAASRARCSGCPCSWSACAGSLSTACARLSSSCS